MKIRCLPFLASLVLSCWFAAPGFAGISPYIRFDFGANQLEMTEGNQLINEVEADFQAGGLPADFESVGPGYGPSGAVGLWLFPAFRIGATYSHLRSVRHNVLHVPGQIYFADDLDFRMTEIGAEAAVRITRLAGLTLGGSIAKGRAEMIEGFAVEDLGGVYLQDANAERSKTTYGAFLGLDQTNDAGVAGYIRVGYQVRDMGRMPSEITISDGVTSVSGPGSTIPLDYSGIYVKAGVGFDLVR